MNQLAHSKLLDEIVDLISIDGEPTEAQAAIDQAAVYVAQKIAAVSESNPMGLRYSQADIDEFVKDHLPLIHEFHKIATDINFERIMAQAKLRPNLKKYDKAFWYILKQKKKLISLAEFYKKEVRVLMHSTEKSILQCFKHCIQWDQLQQQMKNV